MTFESSFSGRIIQITEALDYGDAVSNQIIAIDRLLKDLGFSSIIASQWVHPKVKDKCKHISEISPSDNDVIIYHFVGYAEYTCDYAINNRSTKIILYHNITPHSFFKKNSDLYTFCLNGRNQLKNILTHFHYFWGDSQYNLNELIDLGVDPQRCHVIPIVVPDQFLAPSSDPSHQNKGNWLFLGRIAANKAQIKLVKLFLSLNEKNPDVASHLYLVGGFDERDDYYLNLEREIKKKRSNHLITITGKVAESTKESYFRKADIYVSLSEHEGFGVPLIEAPIRGVPVIAYDCTAVGETMGIPSGLGSDIEDISARIERTICDRNFRGSLVAEQQKNAKRFTPDAVRTKLINALKDVLPSRSHYKSVSIVICTYNRRTLLERCLDYLAFQNNHRFEVIVVDGPSNDGTKEYLKDWAGKVKIAHNPNRNLSESRNIGADLADGDIVAYIDDDAIPFADWTHTILQEFNSRPFTTAALGGPAYYAGSLKYQVEDIGFNRFAEAKANIDSGDIGKNGWFRSLLGTNTAFTRSHLEEVGGFDEQYDYFLDESDLTFRLQNKGYNVSYCPELYLRHEFARSENRTGKYSYNWYSICKNTAYFVSVYSGLSGVNLKKYLKNRLQTERIDPLKNAMEAGEISSEEKDRHIEQVWAGFEQGLKDAERAPRTRKLKPRPNCFSPFPLDNSHKRVNLEIKRLHVCIISKEFPPFGASGGIGTLYYHLASELLLLGHEVTVIMPGTSDDTYDQGRFHIRFVRKDSVYLGGINLAISENISWSLRALKAATEVHNIRSIDIFESALWDTEALAVAMLDREQRPPLIVRLVTPFAMAAKTNGWNVAPDISDQYITAERELIGRADAVVPISNSILSTIQNDYGIEPDHRWSINHCGVAYWPFFDVNSGYSQFGELDPVSSFLENHSKMILFIGRLERRKGIDLLLQAANEFLIGRGDTCLVIAGHDLEGWQRKSEGILSDDVRSRVIFLGNVSDGTREKLLARAYCLVFPSRYESFGLVPLEAYVHGAPVIASRSGAIPEVVNDGVSGLLFDPEDSNALANAVSLLIDDADLREALSQGARNLSRVFSGRSAATKSVDLYASLVA